MKAQNRREGRRRLEYLWLGLLMWVFLACSSFFGGLLGELAVSWSPHVAAALGVFLFRQALRKQWTRALVSGLGLILGLIPWAPQLGDDRAPALSRGARPLRFMVANTFYAPPRLEALTRDLESAGADVLALVEPPRALPGHLAATGRWHVISAHLPGDKHNIALLLRRTALAPEGPLEVLSSEVLRPQFTPSVSLKARMRWEREEVVVLAAHLPAPTDPAQQVQRTRLVPALVAQLETPAVLLGDLNATRASPLWRALMRAGLRRPRGRAPGTWPSWFGGLGLAIDHVLVTEGVEASAARTVWLTRSDHRALVVDLSLTR